MKKTLLSILFVLFFVLTACDGTTVPTSEVEVVQADVLASEIVAEGKLLPILSVELAFAQPGTISEILVTPGENVSAGEIIARLVGSEIIQAEIEAARLEQLLAQQTLDALDRRALLSATQAEETFFAAQELYEAASERWNPLNRDEATELERQLDDYVESETAYRTARVALEDLLDLDEDDRERQDAQEDFDDEKENLDEAYADLLAAVAENKSSLTQEQIDLLLLTAKLEIGRIQLDRLEGNMDPDMLAAAQVRLKVASAHLAAAEAALTNYELRAPFAGVLLSLDDLVVGQVANAGIPVAFLADLTCWQVETTDLAEIDITSVKIGAAAAIKLDAFPGKEFSAKVVEIDPVGREYLGDMTYKVTLELEEADPRFMWNMTATVVIEGE